MNSINDFKNGLLVIMNDDQDAMKEILCDVTGENFWDAHTMYYWMVDDLVWSDNDEGNIPEMPMVKVSRIANRFTFND